MGGIYKMMRGDVMNAIEKAKRDGEDNRIAVWNFFRNNPCHSRGECAKALGLNHQTVGAHAKAIKAGWRPDVCRDCGRKILLDGGGFIAACGRRVGLSDGTSDEKICVNSADGEGFEVVNNG